MNHCYHWIRNLETTTRSKRGPMYLLDNEFNQYALSSTNKWCCLEMGFWSQILMPPSSLTVPHIPSSLLTLYSYYLSEVLPHTSSKAQCYFKYSRSRWRQTNLISPSHFKWYWWQQKMQTVRLPSMFVMLANQIFFFPRLWIFSPTYVKIWYGLGLSKFSFNSHFVFLEHKRFFCKSGEQ